MLSYWLNYTCKVELNVLFISFLVGFCVQNQREYLLYCLPTILYEAKLRFQHVLYITHKAYITCSISHTNYLILFITCCMNDVRILFWYNGRIKSVAFLINFINLIR